VITIDRNAHVASGTVAISSNADPSNPQFDMNITDLSMQSGAG